MAVIEQLETVAPTAEYDDVLVRGSRWEYLRMKREDV
jgi:hypothetical protein